MRPRLAGNKSRQQLDIEAAHQRVLQQDLLLALHVGDVEGDRQAALQPRAEKFGIEMLGAGQFDPRHPPLDRSEDDRTVLDVLVGDREAGIEIAPVNIKQRQLAANFLEVGDRDRLADIGCGDLVDRRLVERGIALDLDHAEHEDRCRGERQRLLRGRRRGGRDAGLRRWLWLDLRQCRGNAAAGAWAHQIGLSGHDRLGKCAAAAEAQKHERLKKEPRHQPQHTIGGPISMES